LLAKEGDPFANAKNSIANAAIDLTGTKGNIEAKARDKAHEIAENWGLTTATADGIIDSLAIQDWRATSLPADVTAIGTHTFEKDGMTLQVTLYDDPTIATVSMYGLAVTMAVPESAQGYVRLASLI